MSIQNRTLKILTLLHILMTVHPPFVTGLQCHHCYSLEPDDKGLDDCRDLSSLPKLLYEDLPEELQPRQSVSQYPEVCLKIKLDMTTAYGEKMYLVTRAGFLRRELGEDFLKLFKSEGDCYLQDYGVTKKRPIPTNKPTFHSTLYCTCTSTFCNSVGGLSSSFWTPTLALVTSYLFYSLWR